jgi:hypothetical protein
MNGKQNNVSASVRALMRVLEWAHIYHIDVFSLHFLDLLSSTSSACAPTILVVAPAILLISWFEFKCSFCAALHVATEGTNTIVRMP